MAARLVGALQVGLALAFAGCAALPPLGARAVLRGEAGYRERMALPPGASIEVRLLREDASGEVDVVDAWVGEAPRSVPIPFELRYAPRRVDPDAVYRVEALIAVGQRPWFATPHPAPRVELPAGDAPIQLLLVRVR